MFNTLIKKLGSRELKDTRIRNRRQYQPRLEGLEGRISLTTLPVGNGTMTNGGSTLSPTPTQWSHP